MRKFKKAILVVFGMLVIFCIGIASEETRYKKQETIKAQVSNFNNEEEIEKLRNLEIKRETGETKETEKQRNEEIKENGEIKENEEIGNRKSKIEENKEIEKLRNLEIEEETNQVNQSNQSNQWLVACVIDGDTIELENGQKVRYIGVDTPELVDPRKPVQCFGKEASVKNEELVLGKKARLEKDVSETDKYGRLLRYVYIGDVFINLELVKQGYAFVATFPPDVKFSSVFAGAEKEARENGRGLWGICKNE